ncbi:MAG: hypothetical protein RI933_656, partial [Actinomycetota bacterium]
VGRIEPKEHQRLAADFAKFLNSGDRSYIDELTQRMSTASENQEYELAAALRDDAKALAAVLEKSTVVFSDQTDADLFGIAEDELSAAVSHFVVRGGRIRGARNWVLDKELERDPAELVEYILQNVYSPKPGIEPQEIPREILVPVLPSDHREVALWLSDLRGSKVQLRVAQRGDKAALAETAVKNAQHAQNLYKMRRSADFTSRADALAGIQRALNLEDAPLRIECFDVSHLGGTNVVASMVVFEDGLPKKNEYRKFNVEGTKDDTESIHQVLTRRLRYLVQGDPEADGAKFSYRPNLIIVDGGLPQVNAAAKALVEAGITDIALCGLAKRLEEVWLPGDAFPIILPRATEELFLLQRIRDEAHRFAITFQRKKRSLSISSQLLEIPGLGERRVSLLLRHFGSAKRMRLATVAEIASVPNISEQLAEIIHATLNADGQKLSEK